MTGLPSYSTTASENVSANTGFSMDEGMAPALVNNGVRQFMADERLQWNDLPWFQYGVGSKTVAAVYASGTSFTLAGADATAYWHAKRRVRAVGSSTGTIYGRVVSSAFATATTTATVVWDSGSLSNETLTISAGLAMTGTPGGTFVNTGSGPTLDASGYSIDSAGQITQWGYIISPGGTITFPKPFPNQMTHARGNSCESGTALLLVTCFPISNSQMGITMSGGSGGTYASWEAKGY